MRPMTPCSFKYCTNEKACYSKQMCNTQELFSLRSNDDLFSMNYFLLRFTPTATERLTRERACAVGSAHQSCLIRRSPNHCRGNRRRNPSFSQNYPFLWGWGCRGRRWNFLKPNSSTICHFSPFSETKRATKHKRSTAVAMWCFRAHPWFRRSFPLSWCCSVWGRKCWEATLTDLNWCDSTTRFPEPPGA